MKDLKILKSKSEQAAIQFGGLYHKFLWRGKKNNYYLEPDELTEKPTGNWILDLGRMFTWTPGLTAIGSLEDKKDSQDVPDVPKAVCLRRWTSDLYSHNDSSSFLIKPAQANWDSDSALRTLDSLAKKIIPYTSQIEIGSNNDPLYKFLNDINLGQASAYDVKLLLILHIFIKSEPLYITCKYFGASKHTEAQKGEPYVRTINDVFSSSALLCEMLLDDTDKASLKKRKPVKKAIETVIDEYPDLEHKEKALTGKVNEKLESWGYEKTTQEVVKSTLYRLRKGKK